MANSICEEFPLPDGIYIGFKDGEDVNETDFTWVFRDTEESTT